MIAGANLASLLQAFFTDRLMAQRQASPHTIASYRDTFCLLLRFAQEQLGKAPSSLALPDLDAPLIGAFLQHLEQTRGNSPRSRNVRLAAIHTFFRYTALHVPDQSALVQHSADARTNSLDRARGRSEDWQRRALRKMASAAIRQAQKTAKRALKGRRAIG